MEQDANKNLTSGAFHFPDANGNHTYTYDNTPVANSATMWHDYAMEWTEDSIILMVDDVVFHTLDNAANPYFDNPHFLLLNVAMGGALGGAIPPSFTSSTMEIDFVRVYEKGILPPIRQTTTRPIMTQQRHPLPISRISWFRSIPTQVMDTLRSSHLR